MPQLSLYLTQEQLIQIKNEAKANKLSLSKWVVSQITTKIEPRYPEDWVNLFGSVQDDSFTRPRQPKNKKREQL